MHAGLRLHPPALQIDAASALVTNQSFEYCVLHALAGGDSSGWQSNALSSSSVVVVVVVVGVAVVEAVNVNFMVGVVALDEMLVLVVVGVVAADEMLVLVAE